MKTAVSLVIAGMFLLTGCSSSGLPISQDTEAASSNISYGKLINKKVHTEEWKNLKVDIYYLGIDKVGEEFAFAFPNAKPKDEIIAVRYEFINTSDKPINMYGLNIANAGFDNPKKPLGSVNYSSLSLHVKLGYDTLPKDWDGTTKWILQPNETKSVSFDWLVENNNYIMTYSWLLPFEKEYRVFAVTFK